MDKLRLSLLRPALRFGQLGFQGLDASILCWEKIWRNGNFAIL
jgi:hypothetical protein